jgi:2,4-dienoyl-CoA reductase-like NADH-dependent reductase (Old Yellow Enzyme family)
MSKRQRESHADKEASRRRWFPGKSAVELQQMLQTIHDANHIIGYVLETGLTQGFIPEEQSRMFGANYTIAAFVTNRIMDILQRDMVLAQKETDLIQITRPALLGPDGR